jgi:hypothetical protein
MAMGDILAEFFPLCGHSSSILSSAWAGILILPGMTYSLQLVSQFSVSNISEISWKECCVAID